MAQRQFRSDDTDKWKYGFGQGVDGNVVVSSPADLDYEVSGFAGSNGAFSGVIDDAVSGNFVNGMLVLIIEMRGDDIVNWELNKVISGGGTTTLGFEFALTRTYSDNTGAYQAQIIEMKQWVRATINAAYDAPAWDGHIRGIFAAFASEEFELNDVIGANGKGYLHGEGGSGITETSDTGDTGESYTGPVILGSPSTPGASSSGVGVNAGGGQGATGRRGPDSSGGGGGAGHGTAGTAGASGNSVVGGVAGTTYDNTSLTILKPGSGGGGGGKSKDPNGQGGGNGGNGGGIVMLFGRKITINPSTGGIVANGADGQSGFPGNGGGGGAGAGGSILLKCIVPNLGGSNRVLALGGTGGGGNGDAGNGGNGGAGRIHIDSVLPLPGGDSTNPAIDSRIDTSLADNGAALLFI